MIIVDILLRLSVMFLFGQAAFFKFSGAEESIYIFEKMEMEPIGRYGISVVEVVVVLLMFVPKLTWLAAMLGLGVMGGAIYGHLTKLGVVVNDDGGMLFGMAIAAAACCAVLLFFHRGSIPIIKSLIRLDR